MPIKTEGIGAIETGTANPPRSGYIEAAGEKLRRTRERLNLRVRDVEEASAKLAEKYRNEKFVINISRLSEIENQRKMPTVWRLYSLCVIYRLNVLQVLEWYGLDFSNVPADSQLFEISRTHLLDYIAGDSGEVTLPLKMDPGVDLKKTNYVSRAIQRWGKLPLVLLNNIDLRSHRYGYIGTEDWRMFPILHPGAFVMLDDTRRRIQNSGWTNEWERPLYFLEHRDGFLCGWCNLEGNQLVLSGHPASKYPPLVYTYPREVDVVGVVSGIAMTLQGSGTGNFP